jgi:hypothetical protein
MVAAGISFTFPLKVQRPAFAITTSRCLIPWVLWRLAMASWASVGEVLSRVSRLRRELVPTGSVERETEVKCVGVWTLAIAVLFGRER